MTTETSKMATSPYKILGVPENTPLLQVREVFKKKILQHHPDKGGDADYFNILQEAYKFILKKHKKQNQYREKIEKEVKQQNYQQHVVETELPEVNHINAGEKDFNVNKFNQMFDKFRLTDPNMDKGYTDQDFQEEDLGDLDFQGKKVGQDEFNRRFAMIKKKQSKDVIVYKEPEPLWSIESNTKLGKNFSLLGEDVDDFSNKMSGIEITDYKKAYQTKFINPDDVAVNTYKNVEQLKSARETVSHQMSEDEKRYRQLKEQEEEERERKRQDRQRQFDERAERNFQEINRRLLTQR